MTKKEAELFVRMDQRMYDQLNEEAEKIGETRSAVARTALRAWLESRGHVVDGGRDAVRSLMKSRARRLPRVAAKGGAG